MNITGGSLTGLAGGVTFSLPIVMGSSGSGAIFDTSGSSLSVPSPISGPGDLVKMGPGTLVLSGSDSYLGGTYVDGGTLEVTNAMSLPDGTRLTIGAGATFIFDPAAGAAPAAASPLAAASGAAAVPEPGTLVLLATGTLLAIFAARQRRKRQLPFGLSGRCTLPTRTIRGSGSAVAGVVLAWAISCGSSPVWAGTYTWIGSPTGIDWNDPANWGGTLPGSADIGLFPAGSYISQPSIISPASVGGIWDTGAGSVSIGGTNALTLFGTTINDNPNTGIELDAGAGPLTINAPLILQNNQQWVNNSASLLTVNGPVSGAGSLTLLGSGMLTLTGMNTYSGNTTVDGGTLQLAGGQLVSPVQYVGNLGIGNFVQSGGINVLSGSGELYLGYAPGEVEATTSAAVPCRRRRKFSAMPAAAPLRSPAASTRCRASSASDIAPAAWGHMASAAAVSCPRLMSTSVCSGPATSRSRPAPIRCPICTWESTPAAAERIALAAAACSLQRPRSSASPGAAVLRNRAGRIPYPAACTSPISPAAVELIASAAAACSPRLPSALAGPAAAASRSRAAPMRPAISSLRKTPVPQGPTASTAVP